MTRNAFNWHYNTANPLGHSHARDVDTSHWATFTNSADPLDTPIRKIGAAEQAYIDEVELEKSRNPHLLGNRYA